MGAVRVYLKWSGGHPDTGSTAAARFGSSIFLVVVTTDGQLYSFQVDYATDPTALNISFIKDSLNNDTPLSEKDKALLSGELLNEATFQSINQEINQQRRFLHIHSRQQKMLLALQSIWLKDKVMWLGLELKNKSLIDFTPSFIRFFARDKKRQKRTAIQEIEISPIYKNTDSTLAGEQSQKKVFAFQPFTLPKTQPLIIRVGEQNGGRLLTLKVSHKAILKARLLL